MKKYNVLLSLTIVLTASFVCQADPMILQPNLGWLAEEFSTMKYSAITTIITLSAAFLGFAAFFTGKLSAKTGKKKLLLTGTFLFAAGGTISSIAHSFPLLLTCRAIEGLGAGFSITVTMTLIPELFKDETKSSKIIGVNAVATALFGTVIGTAAGYLGEISWRYANLIYVFGFVILLFQIVNIPADKKFDTTACSYSESKTTSHAKISNNAYSVAIMAFLFAVISTIFMTSVAAFTIENGLGSSSEAGITISVMMLGSLFIGFAFAHLFAKFQSFTPIISFIFMAAGVILPTIFTMFSVVCISAFMFGIGYGIYFPYINAEAIRISSPENTDANMSLINGGYYTGMFASSFLMEFIGNIFNNSSATFMYEFMGVAFIIFIIYYLIKAYFEYAKITISLPFKRNRDDSL